MNNQYNKELLVKAGVCRPCDTTELTATSCNFSYVDGSRKFALIGNF